MSDLTKKFAAKWPEYDLNKTYYSISDKLPTEEETAQACSDAEVFLGKNGRMLESSPFVVENAYLITKEHGEIWYGDIDLREDARTIADLSRAVGTAVYVIPDTARFIRGWQQSALSPLTAENGYLIKSRYTNVDR